MAGEWDNPGDDSVRSRFNCLVIPLKDLELGAPIVPRSKVYRAEWKNRSETVAVKIEGWITVHTVSV